MVDHATTNIELNRGQRGSYDFLLLKIMRPQEIQAAVPGVSWKPYCSTKLGPDRGMPQQRPRMDKRVEHMFVDCGQTSDLRETVTSNSVCT